MDETTAEFDSDILAQGWSALPDATPARHANVTWAARTDMGRVRENNEDKFDFFLPDDPKMLAARGRLWAVADGMGGHQGGQIASENALKTLIRAYYAPTAAPDTETALSQAVQEANALIFRAAQTIGAKAQGMGTTLVCLIIREGRATIAHVGDSRIYRLSGDGILTQMTTDHSWVEEQVRRGALSRAEAEASPYRNYILRSVGVEPTVEPEVASFDIRAGDTFLLCSDGLTTYLTDDALTAALSPHTGRGPSQTALDLIDAANAAGGKDNITALIVRIQDVAPA